MPETEPPRDRIMTPDDVAPIAAVLARLDAACDEAIALGKQDRYPEATGLLRARAGAAIDTARIYLGIPDTKEQARDVPSPPSPPTDATKAARLQGA